MEEPRCRPTIIEADEAIIDFDQLRHPSMALRRDFVANDVKLGGNDEGTMLLTGPVSMNYSFSSTSSFFHSRIWLVNPRSFV